MPSHQALSNLASLNPASATSSSSQGGSFSHRRRRSSAANPPQELNLQGASFLGSDLTSGGLSPIPGTPVVPMSLSRSPSPRPGGGWASPGLSSPHLHGSGRSSPAKSYRANGGHSVTWESAKAKSDGISGYPSFSTQNNGFFNRHYRRISSSLPRFNMASDKSYAEKEKLGRGRWMGAEGSKVARLRALVWKVWRKLGIKSLIVFALIFMYCMFYITRKDITLYSATPTNHF